MDGPDDASRFPALFRQLDECPEDTEPTSVAVTHESEWCISVSRGGLATLEHRWGGSERRDGWREKATVNRADKAAPAVV